MEFVEGHTPPPGTKQRIWKTFSPCFTYHTIASPVGFPAFKTTASGGTLRHSPAIGTSYPPSDVPRHVVLWPSAISQQGMPFFERTDLNQSLILGSMFSYWPLSKPKALWK